MNPKKRTNLILEVERMCLLWLILIISVSVGHFQRRLTKEGGLVLDVAGSDGREGESQLARRVFFLSLPPGRHDTILFLSSNNGLKALRP